MIQSETRAIVKDNSGALIVSCIRCLKGSKKNNATVGEYFIASVKKSIVKKKKPILKGSICKALIVTTVKERRRLGNFFIKSNINGVVLINEQKSPISSRIFGPVFKDLRSKNLTKILSIAEFIV